MPLKTSYEEEDTEFEHLSKAHLHREKKNKSQQLMNRCFKQMKNDKNAKNVENEIMISVSVFIRKQQQQRNHCDLLLWLLPNGVFRGNN